MPMPNELELLSPVGADKVSFKWPLSGGDKQEGAQEIIDTVKYIADDIPELKHILRTKPLTEYDKTSYSSIKELVDKYNQAIDFILMEKGPSELEEQRNRRASPQVLKHILQQVYSSAIDDPEKLNQYPPFSPEVYGETSFELIQQMIDKVSVSEGDTFIDLGSGVGQVVLQMAAMTPCKKCVGIEKAERPAMYAKEMDRHFRRWMAFYGKTYGQYEIIKGDFLKEEHSEDIKRSTLVFVNNFAFGPDVDHKLKLIFMDLQEGARIVSSKAFCQRHSRINNRSLSDIGTMLDVEEMKPLGGSVSWTDKPVTYFVHVVNREKLVNYFSSKKEVSKAKKMKKDCNKNRASDSDSASNSKDSSDSQPGPTTRRAWNDYCTQQTKNSLSDEENVDAKPKEKKPMRRKKKISRPKPPPPSPRVLRPKPALINHNAIAALAASPPLSREPSPVPMRQAKARKNRKTKPKKNKKPILGLDILHSQTLGSLSSVGDNEPPPPAPGCVDLKLDSVVKQELEVKEEKPTLNPQVVRELEEFVNKMKNRLLDYLTMMTTDDYKTMIFSCIAKEKARKNSLDLRSKQLAKQINELNGKSVKLLRDHLAEFGATSPAELMASARGIVKRQKELRAQVGKINNQVEELEETRKQLERQRDNEVVELYKRQGMVNGGVTLTSSGYADGIKSEVPHKEKEVSVGRPSKEKRRTQELASIAANMPKIEEQNPDALAKKILALEHNRQLEQSRIENRAGSTTQVLTVDTGDHLNKALLARGNRKGKTVSETPRVDDFQERLKSIITSVLKEGDGNSVPITTIPSASVYYSKPTTSSSNSTVYSTSANLGLKIEPHPSYNHGIPDYTQMSPAKLALKRHLSTQDTKPVDAKNRGSFLRVTEGDAEKTVEITSQSIINAAVDMSYSATPKLPNNYSPISRPSSAEAPPEHGLAARLDSMMTPATTSRYEVKTEVTTTMVTTTAIKKETTCPQQDLPVEGLAAIFQDRFAQDPGPLSPPEIDIKEKYLNIKTEKKTEEKEGEKWKQDKSGAPLIKKEEQPPQPKSPPVDSQGRPEDGIENNGKKWKDRINFGFDKLVAFASEVDKRRKSTESGSAGGSGASPEARGSVRDTLALKFKGMHKSEEGADTGTDSLKVFITEEMPSKIKRTMSECDVSSERKAYIQRTEATEKESKKRINMSKRHYLETSDLTREAGPSSTDARERRVPSEDRKGIIARSQELCLPRCLPVSQPEQDSYDHHFKKKYFHARNQRNVTPVIEQGHYQNNWQSYQVAPPRNHVPVSLVGSRPTTYRRGPSYSTYIRGAPKYRAGNSFYTPQPQHFQQQQRPSAYEHT